METDDRKLFIEKQTNHIFKICRGWIMERSEVPHIPVIAAGMYGPGPHNVVTEADTTREWGVKEGRQR